MLHVRILIAERIRHRLQALKISNKEFARLMGTQPPAITKWLSGDHNFTVDTLAEIEVALKFRIFMRTESDTDSDHACFPCVIGQELFIKK